MHARLKYLLTGLLVVIPGVALASDQAPDLEQLLDTASAEVLTEWGIAYENGEGVPRDFDRAVRLYCTAAWEGHARAEYQLGWMYANGRGLARDDALAAAWFRRAASRGDQHAKRMLSVVDAPGARKPALCIRPTGEELLALPEGNSPEDRERIVRLVRRYAPRYELDPALVLALIEIESNFDSRARSPKNAQGLMQLIPATAKRFGVDDIMHPLQNLHGGMAYLRWLLGYFKGDLRLALAGYNAGEGAVTRYDGIPPYRETRNYVKAVTRLYNRATLAPTDS